VRVWVYLPLVLSFLFPLAARRMAAMLRPTAAARAAAIGAAVAALAYACCLTLLSLTLFDDLPPLSAFDNRPELGLPKPVPGWLASIAALILLAGTIRFVREVVRRYRTVRELRAIGVPHAGLAVADLPEPFAVAIPGRPGHVLVTSGMLRLFDGVERQVLLAHEHSHLERRHHRLVAVAVLAAAMNPLLTKLAHLVAFLVERAADEDAAAEVGNREVVARAVAKASLAGSGRGLAPALGLNGSKAVERVAAIAGPQPTSRWHGLAGMVTLGAGMVLVTAVAVVEFVAVAEAWLGMLLR
jgi:Zn-dependent protease with chaperone function